MNYTDHAFLIFFVTVFVIYYAVKKASHQIVILIAASLLFYAYESPSLLVVFLTSWLVTAVSSFVVLNTQNKTQATMSAVLGVVTNLSLLLFFKYKFLFINTEPDIQLAQVYSINDWLLSAPLPIGISFYTFHGISLMVDTARGDRALAEREHKGFIKHLLDTLLYLVFFPQLIAGPIIKAKDFFPQVTHKRFGNVDIKRCFQLLILGYFLKSVIADNLSEQTFWIASPYFQWKSSVDLLLLLYGYSAQIFADFAGYSLIAMGLAGLLGYKLPDNFNFPYIASSVSDFWRRWHISLSSWLRDYLYIPLGGSQKGKMRMYANLLIVMFLGGLWHGAAWSFAIWGLWHGIALVIERPFLDSRFMTSANRMVVGVRIFLVFNFVSIGWLFFKLQDFSQAFHYIEVMLTSEVRGFSKSSAFFLAVYVQAVFFYHLFSCYRQNIPVVMKDIMYGIMLFLILTSAGPETPFIYFQF